jgi:hypothetical protein
VIKKGKNRYLLVMNEYASTLSSILERHLNDGWELYGNPFVFVRDYDDFYCQAIIKKETSDKEFLHSGQELENKG